MKTIIAPTDFSTAATNSVYYAADLATFFNARLILVNACQLRAVSYDVPFSEETIATMYASSQESLAKLKDELVKKYGQQVPVECVSGIGSAFDIITATAESLKADMIVMGVVGEAGLLRERIIGSTALTIARQQAIPTFIIPETITYNPIRKISFACDLEKNGQAELLYKTKLFCKVFHAELEIVHVSDPAEIPVIQHIHQLQLEPTLSNIKHKTVYLEGMSVVKELEDYFNSHDTDMIVVSPQKHNLLYYLFNNSITRNLTFHVKLPILAIH